MLFGDLDSWESLGLQGDPTSPFYRKSVQNIHWKGWCWSRNSNIWPPDVKNWLFGKDPAAGQDWGQEERGMTEDEMVWWHDGLYGYESEQAPGVGDGQGGQAMLQSTGLQSRTSLSDWTEFTWIFNLSLHCFLVFGYKSCTSFVKCIPKYLNLFDSIENGIVP